MRRRRRCRRAIYFGRSAVSDTCSYLGMDSEGEREELGLKKHEGGMEVRWIYLAAQVSDKLLFGRDSSKTRSRRAGTSSRIVTAAGRQRGESDSGIGSGRSNLWHDRVGGHFEVVVVWVVIVDGGFLLDRDISQRLDDVMRVLGVKDGRLLLSLVFLGLLDETERLRLGGGKDSLVSGGGGDRTRRRRSGREKRRGKEAWGDW